MKKLSPIVRYKGSKYSRLSFLLPLLKPSKTYIEPFCGFGSVFLNKRPVSRHNILNDRNELIVNLLVQVRDNFEELARLVEYTPICKTEYAKAAEMLNNPSQHSKVNLASALVLYLNHGFDKTLKNVRANNFTFVTTASAKGGMTERTGINASSHIYRVADFFTRNQVIFENKYAMDIIRKINSKKQVNDVLVYCDPPYFKSNSYDIEMPESEHELFLKECNNLNCKVAISNFENSMYDDMLEKWNKRKCTGIWRMGKEQYADCLWTNYETV